jgi:hypothetical protein
VVPPPRQGPTKGKWVQPFRALTPAAGLPDALPARSLAAAAPKAAPKRRATRRAQDEEEEEEEEKQEDPELEEAAREGPRASAGPARPLRASSPAPLRPPSPAPATEEARPAAHPLSRQPFSGFFVSKQPQLDAGLHENVFVCGESPTDRPTLAAVGIDLNASGHHKWTSVPAFRQTPLIGCASRAELLAWLAALGAVTDHGVDDGTAASAINSAPSAASPQPRWAGWREDVGTRSDGAPIRTFMLLGADGCETPAVHAVQSSRTHSFTYASLLPRPGLPVGTALGGREDVVEFMAQCMREGASADVGADAGAGAAAHAAVGNVTDGGSRQRAQPQRFDPRPEAPPLRAKELAVPPAPVMAAAAPALGGGLMLPWFGPPFGAASAAYGAHALAPPPLPRPALPPGRPLAPSWADATTLAQVGGPNASQWAFQTPSQAEVDRFRGWRDLLERYFLTINPLSDIHAMDILVRLEQQRVTLELLEASGIGRVVTALRKYGRPQVADVATRICSGWQRTAAQVMAACHPSGAALAMEHQ